MKAGQILKLAGQNYVNSCPEHLREGLIKQLNVVLSTADTFNEELSANAKNSELSPEGRSAGSARVAASALATLKAVETTTIKTLTERAVSLEQTLLGKVTYTPPKDPAERIAHELHLQEIRSQLRELPAAERLNVYRTSADPLVLAAIETAPMTLSERRQDGSRRLEHFIDPEERTAVALTRAEAADPTTAQTLRELRALRQTYVHAVNGVRKEILDEVPEATIEPELVVHT
jgi:hypothetical protein